MLWALLAVFIAGNAFGVFAMALIGIHIEQRHMQDGAEYATTHAEFATRRLLGVYVRKPANLPADDERRR